MNELKDVIVALEAEIVALKAGDKTLDNARLVLAKKEELATARASLIEIETAFAEDEAPAEEAAPAEEEAAPAVEAAPAEETAPIVEVVTDEPAEAAPVEDEVVVEPEAVIPVALAASGVDTDASPTVEADEQRHPGFTLTAAGNMGGVATGAELTRDKLAAMLNASNTGRHPSGGKVRILEMNRFASDVRVPSSNHGAIENTRIIAEARKNHQQPLSLVAGACFCGPDEVDPSIAAVGRRGRPVAGVFPSIPINGGFRYLRDLAIDPDSGSVNIWTCTDQDAVDPDDPDTWKICSELDCFDEIDVVPYMVTGCTTVRRQQQWAHPEQVDAWLNKLMIEYDRVAERQLLDLIEADATPALVVGNGTMLTHGLLSQLEYALGSLSFSLGYQFRADALAGHTVIIPRGFTQALLTDELIRGFPSGIRTESELRSLITGAYGVNLVERLDESTSQAAAAAATVTNLNTGGAIDTAPPFLQTELTRLYVVKPDQWVHGEGVLVGADWHTDNELLRQNKTQYFWENVEVLERTGVEHAYLVDIEGCINGGRSDLVTPPDCEA